MARAANLVQEFTRDMSLDEYQQSELRKSAVERQFIIIGEALSQLGRIDEASVASIDDHERIIAFRNILVHGYAVVDDKVVWDLIVLDVPRLIAQLQCLLEQKTAE